MPRLRLTLKYDGTAYAGWQVQPNGPSIQAAVQQAFATLYNCWSKMSGTFTQRAATIGSSSTRSSPDGSRCPGNFLTTFRLEH